MVRHAKTAAPTTTAGKKGRLLLLLLMCAMMLMVILQWVFVWLHHASPCEGAGDMSPPNNNGTALLWNSKSEFIASPRPIRNSNRNNKNQQPVDLPRLLDLVNSHPETSCPLGLELVSDYVPSSSVQNHWLNINSPPSPRHNSDNPLHVIPPVVHVTSKSRCVLPQFAQVLQQWKSLNYTQQLPLAFVLHNDAALEDLLQRADADFANLQTVLHHCVTSGAEKADLWRAVVLWYYGGWYTDMDNAPTILFREYLSNNSKSSPDNTPDSASSSSPHVAFFVVEQQGMLSQYFLAATPRHPLLYGLIQTMIHRLLALNQVANHYTPYVTGPGALKRAFELYLQQQGDNQQLFQGGGGSKNNNNKKETPNNNFQLKEGTYHGWNNSTVIVIGKAKQSNDYIQRNVIYKKKRLYKQMNMTHFSQETTGVEDAQYAQESCWERIYRKALSQQR